ncbi:MAG: S24 family peptidase [Sphingobium sp.]
MDEESVRRALDRLITTQGENYGAMSRLLGRNAAYIQQYIKRGSPRKLDEDDRRTLARYFGVDERVLGGRLEPSAPMMRQQGSGGARSSMNASDGAMAIVPRLALGASAGAGMLDADESLTGAIAFDPIWLKSMHLGAENLSIIHVDGESMAPTLNDGDDIMVDRSDAVERLRDGVYVLRLDDVLMVKRVALAPGRTQGEWGDVRIGRVLSVSSDNPHYPTWPDVDPALVDIVGRVVWAGRRFR